MACAVSAGLGDGLADAASRPRWSSASRPDALAEPDALEELGELDDGSTGFWVARKLRTRCTGSGTKSEGTEPPSAPVPSILMGPVNPDGSAVRAPLDPITPISPSVAAKLSSSLRWPSTTLEASSFAASSEPSSASVAEIVSAP